MKYIRYLLACTVTLSLLSGCAQPEALKELPVPEPAEGLRGEQFGIDKNINEATIDEYLMRPDSVYRDVRMLKDEAEYEAIGGDSWLSGFVEGFEVVPYPMIVNVEGLPEEVGSSYSGTTLFTHDAEGYHANYEESMNYLEYLFPKDKTIFLMCGGGGYAGMMKNMLAELGWDETKIYNTGGFWFYEGDHAVDVKREENGKAYYDFFKVNYHYLDFTSMHPVDGYEGSSAPADKEPAVKETLLEEKSAEEVGKMLADGETFALSLYLPGCSSCIGFAPVAREFADAGRIPFYSMNYNAAKEIDAIASGIEYTPSVVLVQEGKVTAVLSSAKDEDSAAFRSTAALSEWFHEHAGTAPVEGSAVNSDEDCDTGCRVDFSSEDGE